MADSYNEIVGKGSHSRDARLKAELLLQDDAASTSVSETVSSFNGTLVDAGNTADVSTTGPNGWVPKAFQLDGANDYIGSVGGVADFKYLHSKNLAIEFWASFDTDNTRFVVCGNGPASSEVGFFLNREYLADYGYNAIRFTSYRGVGGSVCVNGTTDDDTATADGWHHWCFVGNGDGLGIWYKDGLPLTTTVRAANTLTVGSASGANAPRPLNIGRVNYSTDLGLRFDGGIAGFRSYNDNLAALEVAELAKGPEPLNTVAPSLSGTQTVGETLTSTSGTWDSQSNGTLSYAYQWTRSDDDSGTGEADISGATNSTYTLTVSDEGKHIRCRVRSSNDGDYDAAEDTSSEFTGAIAAGGSGTNYDLGNIDSTASVASDANSLSASLTMTDAGSVSGVASAADTVAVKWSIGNADSQTVVVSDSPTMGISATLADAGSRAAAVSSADVLSMTAQLSDAGSITTVKSEPSDLTVDTGAIDLGNVDSVAKPKSASGTVSITAGLSDTGSVVSPKSTTAAIGITASLAESKSVAAVQSASDGVSVEFGIAYVGSVVSVSSLAELLTAAFTVQPSGSAVAVQSEPSDLTTGGNSQAFLRYYLHYLGA